MKEANNIHMSEFKELINFLCKYFAEQNVLIGNEVYDNIIELSKEYASEFIFIKCDLLSDGIVFFSNNCQLGNKVIAIKDVISFNRYVNNIKTHAIAINKEPHENNVTIIGNDGKVSILLLLDDGSIKLTQNIP